MSGGRRERGCRMSSCPGFSAYVYSCVRQVVVVAGRSLVWGTNTWSFQVSSDGHLSGKGTPNRQANGNSRPPPPSSLGGWPAGTWISETILTQLYFVPTEHQIHTKKGETIQQQGLMQTLFDYKQDSHYLP